MTERGAFWSEAFALRGSATPLVMPRVICSGLFAFLVWAIWWYGGFNVALSIAPYEVAGAVLAILFVLRTNSGYDRWWEARKLWGGIVNQSRNLALMADAYGPQHGPWREQVIRWTAAFSHVCRASLRDERELQKVSALLGADVAQQIAEAGHMPSYVAKRIAQLLREAADAGTLDRYAFLQADRERALLIDHIGACERILKTPIPRAHSIKIRRFLVLFIAAIPFALLDRVGWLTPVVTMMVAYPLLSIDLIGHELQNPFSKARLSHLPLDDICQTIETGLLEIIDQHDSPQTLETEPYRASARPPLVRGSTTFHRCGLHQGPSIG